MKIALFYANWEAFGEPWSTPLGVKWELEARGHQVVNYNLYHDNGQLLPRKKIRTYSAECFNQFNVHYKDGYRPDAVLVMDYGPFDAPQMDKKFFPGVPFILEAGDTPQSARMHGTKLHKFDAVITPDKLTATEFAKFGLVSEWVTHWADHRIFHPRYDVEPEYDCISTCGGRRVTAAIEKELGARFNNERYFHGEDHARRLLKGKMVFQCSQFKEITRRVFEGMAVGRMVITDRLPDHTGINKLFVEDEDIVYYDTAEEAIDKIKYYSEHADERERIARNGFDKTTASHTVSNRIDCLEHIIKGLKEKQNV